MELSPQDILAPGQSETTSEFMERNNLQDLIQNNQSQEQLEKDHDRFMREPEKVIKQNIDYPNPSKRINHQENFCQLDRGQKCAEAIFLNLNFGTCGSNSLQYLDFRRNFLGTGAIKALCRNSHLSHLKSLYLDDNPLGNTGIKFIADSNWTDIQTLSLCNIHIDYQGVTWLALNESWKNIEVLDLSYNPSIGDRGAITLSFNQTWTKLKRLSVADCGLGTLGLMSLKRNKNFHRRLVIRGRSTTEEDDSDDDSHRMKRNCKSSGNYLTKKFIELTHYSQNITKDSFTHPRLSWNWRCQNSKNIRRRGGFPHESENSSSDHQHSQIIAKFKKYREKILSDMNSERVLKLFIEISATVDPTHHSHFDKQRNEETELFELAFDIRQRFLGNECQESPKILLLTGQPGAGKSLFCKRLERELLSEWNESPEKSELDNGNWFPIYIGLSSQQFSNLEMIPDILARELSLTKTEIRLLQNSEQTNLILPRLLLIFDDAENFFTLTKIQEMHWSNAKFIFTCREEYFQGADRRELLFGPMKDSLLPLDIGVFLHRKIEPLSDQQIFCYLRKRCFSNEMEALKNKADEEPTESPFDVKQAVKPPRWYQAKEIENLIDEYNLRETARIPLMLWVIVEVLPIIAAQDVGQAGGIERRAQSKILSNRFLIEKLVEKTIKSAASRMQEVPREPKKAAAPYHFVKRVVLRAFQFMNNIIKSTATTTHETLNNQEVNQSGGKVDQLNHLEKRIMALLQELARKLCHQSQNEALIEENTLLSELNSLVEWNCKSLRYEFRCSMLRDFFLAKCIEEEVTKITDPLKDSIQALSGLILNRSPLTIQPILFLRDAIIEGTLATNSILNLIHIFRQKDRLSPLQSPLEIAAANSITVLNAAGFDFTNQSLENISITGANLSYGIFEGINFTNANLKGVNFTGAWLKDADFLKANLENVIFDEAPPIKLKNANVTRMAFSLDGRLLAIEISKSQVVVFEIFVNKFHPKEIRRFPGEFPWNMDCPFSQDGKHLVTVVEKRFIIWDIASEQPLDANYQLIQNSTLVHHNSVLKELLFFSGKTIHKYSITSGAWTSFPVKGLQFLQLGSISSDYNKLFLLGTNGEGATLYNTITGKAVFKQTYIDNAFYKLSRNGKNIVLGTANEVCHILDTRRGYIIKSLSKENSRDIIIKCYLNLNRGLLFSATKSGLKIQDVANARILKFTPLERTQTKQVYSFDPTNNQIAVLDGMNKISFKQIPNRFDSLQLPVRGPNTKGLNIKGIAVNNCHKFLSQNVGLFQEEGDYKLFDENTINKLFPDDSTEAAKVKEITLLGSKLTSVHAKIIGSDLNWIQLKKIDLSRNRIGEIGGEAIGKNKSWPNLEELILTSTEIGDKTAAIIANNETWKSLRKLQLSINKIGNAGAIAIGNSKLWANLEVLDLHENQIDNEGGRHIGGNDTWENLTMLGLSSNKITDKTVIWILSSKKIWKNLKILQFHNNPVDMQERDLLDVIEGIASKHLENLTLPSVYFDKDCLRILKYSNPENVTEILWNNKRYNDTNAAIIGGNTTWTNLKKIVLSKNKINDEGGMKVGINTVWNQLEELDLSHNKLGPKAASAIGNNVSWSKLKILNLDYNKIGVIGASELSKNTSWTQLQALSLAGCSINAKGATVLSQNIAWTNLQILNLQGNSIGATGAAELSKSTTWTKLQSLDLAKNSIGDRGATELGKNTSWTNLQLLNLSDNELSDEGATGLSKNTAWTNLQTLNLSESAIEEEGAAELSKNAAWSQLSTLNLSNNPIGDLGAIALAKNRTWVNLQTLILAESEISTSGFSALSNNVTWSNLRVLDLSNNDLGVEGADLIHKNSTWANLHTLYLGGNSILNYRKGGVNLNWNNLVNLQELDLSNNEIGNDGVAKLSKNSWNQLHTLNLARVSIGEKGAIDLGKNMTWTQLRVLNLYGNAIGVQGTAELRKNTTWTNLQELNLSNNSLRNKGAAELSQNTSWTNLQTLQLAGNSIEDEGAVMLIQNKTWRNLQILDLKSNSISAETFQRLKQSPNWPQQLQIEL